MRYKAVPKTEENPTGRIPFTDDEEAKADICDDKYKSLDAQKKRKLRALSAQFRDVRSQGVMVEGSIITTTHEARAEVSGVLEMLKTTGGELEVITRAGAAINLTADVAGGILTAIDGHYLACTKRETALHKMILAALNDEDLEAININDGWPVKPEMELVE